MYVYVYIYIYVNLCIYTYLPMCSSLVWTSPFVIRNLGVGGLNLAGKRPTKQTLLMLARFSDHENFSVRNLYVLIICCLASFGTVQHSGSHSRELKCSTECPAVGLL